MDPRAIRRQFPADVAAVLIRALDQGWRIERTTSGAMLYPADHAQGPIAVHGTPSDRRAFANTLGRMRRAGYDG